MILLKGESKLSATKGSKVIVSVVCTLNGPKPKKSHTIDLIISSLHFAGKDSPVMLKSNCSNHVEQLHPNALSLLTGGTNRSLSQEMIELIQGHPNNVCSFQYLVPDVSHHPHC